MKQAVAKTQTTASTTIPCPRCRRSIVLNHEATGDANDTIGYLHLGEQNYHYIVCMNNKCDFAGDIKIKKTN